MEQLNIIKTLDELDELALYLRDKDYISFDTETTGVVKGSKIIGFSVCADIDAGFYVILAYWDVADQKLKELETVTKAKDFLQLLVGKSLVMQNAPFDCAMVENNYGVKLMPSVVHDVLIGGHLLNENRLNGLKQRGVEVYGEDAAAEQAEMKESVVRNGGMMTKENYELYKGDADLIARYGAKDAILTLKLFYHDVPQLYDENLADFFYNDESMPLLKGPTYELNTTGLRVDPDKLQTLKTSLEAECMEAKAFIHQEIAAHVSEKYPATSPTKTFNIGAGQQLAWLLFIELENEFCNLTKSGKEMCKLLDFPVPYSIGAKNEFIRMCRERKDQVYEAAKWNWKTKKMSRPKKIGDPWKYLATGKETLTKFSKKYKWVETLLKYKKDLKLLNTYVQGIQDKMQYNIIRPSFLQHGTTSGRYSSRSPNFQNLPRDDKRIKACIVSRPGKVFVGADYAQLEPRVFASLSGDERLLACFKNGDDFYSVIGMEVFEKYDCSLKKSAPDSFATLYPDLRNVSKVVGLSTPYGTTAPKMAPLIDKQVWEAQEIINNYFEKFPSVQQLMLDSHEQVKQNGVVYNLFGRPRRMPKALEITTIYGKTPHSELPYEARNMLNLAMNHRVQSTGASIMNRAAIAVYSTCRELEAQDPRWAEVKIVLQVHDELILEGPEDLKEEMTAVLKDAMENTTILPGVDLVAEPKIAYNLADLK